MHCPVLLDPPVCFSHLVVTLFSILVVVKFKSDNTYFGQFIVNIYNK